MSLELWHNEMQHMGIDPVGKVGSLASQWQQAIEKANEGTGQRVGNVGQVNQADEPFEVRLSAKASSVDAVTPLQMLQSGKITNEQYVDMRIEQATRHLVGIVDDQRLEAIRVNLRDMIEHDPGLNPLRRRIF